MSSPKESSGARTLAGYALMISATVGLYWLIRGAGSALLAPEAPAGQPRFGAGGAAAQLDVLVHVLLALVVVIVVARAIGSLFKYFQQPAVVGEIVAGILLGPSALGHIAPSLSHQILPPTVAPFLNVLSQVGVILYMFLVGVELDPALLRKRGHATVAISHASIIAPFLLGSSFALYIYPKLGTNDVPFTCFSLFMGVSMSVTAFPVLARILTDRRIHTTRMGVIALTCAAVDDVTAWCLLAFVVSVVKAKMAGVLVTAGLALGFIALMVFVARPAMVRLSRLYGQRGRLTQGVMALVFVALLISALLTDLIGIHAVFGAFALGAVIPHDSGLARELTDRLEDLVVVLFLPAFFAFTGMRTQIGLVSGTDQWIICGLIIVIASVGKFGGSFVAARLTGLGWRDSAALGTLMNTRGLMELIVLNIGLELRVLSPELFAMLVIMAVTTTFMTTPILHLITRKHPPESEATPAAPSPLQALQHGGVLLPISNPVAVTTLVDLALAATRPEDPPPRVLALVRRPAGGVRSGLREHDEKDRPRAQILLDAADYARTLGAAISPHSMWTDDPAGDILEVAKRPDIRWLLLGFHRPVFGADLLGGVVKEILERSKGMELDVGVVVHGHDRPVDKIIAVVDSSNHGRAALDLASRVALQRQCSLHAVLAPKQGGEPEPGLQEMLKDAARSAGKWLHTDVLAERNPAQLAYKTRGPLVVIGVDLADELGLPLDDAPDGERCVIIVQGGAAAAATAEPGKHVELAS
jgi:Kef-type K+ transport system membrane component KefB/nucleotide-binding universal stress UspA family protein